MHIRHSRRLFRLFAGSCLLIGASGGVADPAHVAGGKVFLADGDLFVFDISNTETPIATVGVVGTATDVTVEDCNAIVTTGEESPRGIEVFDLAEISELEGFCDDSAVSDCGPVTYDPENSVLTVPCVEAFGTIYTLDMKRRGNSDNWYIDFIDEVDDDEGNETGDDDDEQDPEDE